MAEVLHQDIRFSGQLMQDSPASLSTQVNDDSARAPVPSLECTEKATETISAEGLELNNVGAKFGKKGPAKRTDNVTAQLDNLYIVKGVLQYILTSNDALIHELSYFFFRITQSAEYGVGVFT